MRRPGRCPAEHDAPGLAVSSAGVRAGGVSVPEHELVWRFSRAGGPGGQSVNTTDSRAEVVFDLAGSPSVPEHLRQRALGRLAHRLVDGRVSVVASEYRSQHRNREAARARLASLPAGQAATPCGASQPGRPCRSLRKASSSRGYSTIGRSPREPDAREARGSVYSHVRP